MTVRRLPDGSCEFTDYDGRIAWWPDAEAVAQAWLEEWRREAFGSACDFINAMTHEAAQGVLDLLQVFAECAATGPDSQKVGWVGAGPLEDLLSHPGSGTAVVDEVERKARSHIAFSLALRNVWLGKEVDPAIKSRLVALGARDVTRP